MQPDPKVNILLVDDHPENLLALEAILSSLGENLVQATSGEEALRCLLHQDFAVILLDVQMPGMDGFETATLIRSRARSRQTPIIFLTAFSTSDQFVFKGYALGAVDYLFKPIDANILTSKVTVFVDLFKKTEAIRQQTEEVKRQAAQLEAINTELRQSEERFRSLSACSPVGIFITDAEGHCTYTNPRFQAICDFTLEESLGEGWLQCIHPEERERVLSDWIVYTREGREYSDEFRLRTQDCSETRYVHVQASPMLSDRGEFLGHVGTIEDITERKQAEASRRQVIREQIARREAEATNRMKDEFLAVLSHELRTPLNSMLGWARLLQTKKFDDETTARALETIERNAIAQSQLIEDILDVSQIIRGKLRLNFAPVNLVSVIEAAVEAVRPLAEAKTIQLEPILAEAIGAVRGDSVRLQQVVWNLLTNAIKFTPEEGKVEIRLSGREQRSAEVTVTDTGIGINPDFLPNVFDRFRQADSTTTRSHNGLGLGLAIVRHLVELHGGTVQAESLGAGKGATFTLRLPLLQEEDLKVEKGDAQTPHATVHNLLSGLQILVVDDEPDSREFVTVALQEYGAIATAVSSVSEALTFLETFRPDVLVSDIGMPEADGYMLIRQVRMLEADGDHLPAVALTAYSSEEDYSRALSAGFQAHVGKPVEVTQLVEAIAAALV